MNNSANNNDTQTTTKRVFVDLWADATLIQTRRIVIEVPSDCDDREIRHVGGCTLSECVDQQRVDADWETDSPDDFDVHDQINVEDGVPDDWDADLVLIRGEDGNLAVKNSEDQIGDE